MSEKFMPPKLDVLDPKHWLYSEFGSHLCIEYQRYFDMWFDKEIRPHYENAVEVYGYQCVDDDFKPLAKCRWDESPALGMSEGPKQSALLIKVEPLKKADTAEGILREMVEAFKTATIINYQGEVPKFDGALDRARKYLEKK